MSDVVYVSKSRIVRRQGPLRIAHLPGESQPVIYSVHGGIAEHYKVAPSKLTESHYRCERRQIDRGCDWRGGSGGGRVGDPPDSCSDAPGGE